MCGPVSACSQCQPTRRRSQHGRYHPPSFRVVCRCAGDDCGTPGCPLIYLGCLSMYLVGHWYPWLGVDADVERYIWVFVGTSKVSADITGCFLVQMSSDIPGCLLIHLVVSWFIWLSADTPGCLPIHLPNDTPWVSSSRHFLYRSTN